MYLDVSYEFCLFALEIRHLPFQLWRVIRGEGGHILIQGSQGAVKRGKHGRQQYKRTTQNYTHGSQRYNRQARENVIAAVHALCSALLYPDSSPRREMQRSRLDSFTCSLTVGFTNRFLIADIVNPKGRSVCRILLNQALQKCKGSMGCYRSRAIPGLTKLLCRLGME